MSENSNFYEMRAKKEAILGRALEKANIPLSRMQDSRLCQHYTKGCTDMSAEEIVSELQQMDWFQTETNYPIIFGAMIYCHQLRCPKIVHAFQARDIISTYAKCYVNANATLENIEVCTKEVCLLDRQDLKPEKIIVAEMNNYEQHPVRKALLQRSGAPVYIK